MNEIKVNLENLTEAERELLVGLIEKANKKKSKVWKPEVGEIYWSFYRDGGVESQNWDDDSFDNGCYSIGNCFETKEQAEFAFEKAKVTVELQRFADEHNGEIDWNDCNQRKYYTSYDFKDNVAVCIFHTYLIKNSNIYFSAKELAQQAVSQVGEERVKKYYLGVEDD